MSELERFEENVTMLHEKADSRAAALLEWARQAEAFFREVEHWADPLCSEGKASICYKPMDDALRRKELPCRIFQLHLGRVQAQINPPEFLCKVPDLYLELKVFGPRILAASQRLVLDSDGRWRAGRLGPRLKNPPLTQESFFALLNEMISSGLATAQRLGIP